MVFVKKNKGHFLKYEYKRTGPLMCTHDMDNNILNPGTNISSVYQYKYEK